MLDQTWEYTLFGIPRSLKVTLSKEATDRARKEIELLGWCSCRSKRINSHIELALTHGCPNSRTPGSFTSLYSMFFVWTHYSQKLTHFDPHH